VDITDIADIPEFSSRSAIRSDEMEMPQDYKNIHTKKEDGGKK
jgi:hypothetical protein